METHDKMKGLHYYISPKQVEKEGYLTNFKYIIKYLVNWFIFRFK